MSWVPPIVLTQEFQQKNKELARTYKLFHCNLQQNSKIERRYLLILGTRKIQTFSYILGHRLFGKKLSTYYEICSDFSQVNGVFHVLKLYLVHLHFNLVSSVQVQFQIGQPRRCEMISMSGGHHSRIEVVNQMINQLEEMKQN